MPWLSRQPSRQNSGSEQMINGSRSPSLQSMGSVQAATNLDMMPVSFVPAQIDGMCSTTSPHMTQPPATLMRQRALLLLRNLAMLPVMARALCTRAMLREYVADPVACRDLLLQCCLGGLEAGMIFALPLTMLLLPGIASLCILAVCWALLAVMTYPLNEGSKISKIMPEGMSAREADDAADESWIYVNSMMTSHHSHLNHLERLAATFRRPITGVHNRTYGPIIDLLHSLASPLFPSSTNVSLVSQLRLALLSAKTTKVVLIAHGTGSIPMTAALDALHADLPLVCISKLEIYTFGSASTYLNNPLLVLDELSRRDMGIPMPSHLGSSTNGGSTERSRSKSPLPQWTRPDGSIASPVKATLKSLGHRVEDMERVVTHVEHYAMAGDIVARCGVLDAVQSGTARFAGRLFVLGDSDDAACMNREIRRDSGMTRLMGRIGVASPSGDTEAKTRKQRMPTCGTFDEYMDALFPSQPTALSCLDTIPSISFATAERREFIAQSTTGLHAPILASQKLSLGLGLFNANYSPSLSSSPHLSPDDNMPRSRKEKRNSWGTTAMLGVDGVGRARQGAREAEGKSVRQLTRLWRFEGGGRPCGMGVPVLNGVGNVKGDGNVMGKGGMNGMGGGEEKRSP